jgi:hypothetical protein
MRSLLANKVKYYKSFADAIYADYKKLRYGISTCKPTVDMDLAMVRKDIVDWQSNEDDGALSDVQIQYQTWLPVEYDDVLYSRGGTGYIQTGTPTTPAPFGVSYNYGNGSQNIIEVNAGGCITRINLNPAITINQNTSFEFTQPTPATTWDIIHNMGITPNVFTEDINGDDIEGVIEVVNNNRIKIYFTQAVAGKAYLS